MNVQPGSQDLYEVLGVARTASQAELKTAYRQRAKQYHPDKCPNDKSAEDKFKEAANAYQTLSDDTKRAAYDRYGFDGIRRGGGGSAGGPGPAGSGGFDNVEDIFSTFGDLFGDFLGGRMRGRHPPRGADRLLTLQLKFHEAVWGVHKEIKITHSVNCARCNGTGNSSGKAEVCRQCQGRGQIVHAQGFFMVQTTCAPCRGSGKATKDPCSTCNGRGHNAETSTLSLAIPPGISESQRLRVAGKGEGASGGTAGDLYVDLHVEEDPRFAREGADVISEVTISFAKAAIGGEVEIDTLDEACTGKVILELSPGTQPGDQVVRREQGVPHHDRVGRGDHIVKFKIEVPNKLTNKQEKLLREFAAELGEESPRAKRKNSR
jgi:molecular chaperone DnaJ